jgi:hypothetical protein
LDVSITFWRSAVFATFAMTLRYSSETYSGTQIQAATMQPKWPFDPATLLINEGLE